MKQVEHFTWMLPPDIWRKRPHPSSFKMDAETALSRYPGATPILHTREVRILPDTEEEIEHAKIGHSSPYSPNMGPARD